MSTWEYAVLVWHRQPAEQGGWEIVVSWHPPDGSDVDMTGASPSALFHLNRAGADGWELVSVTQDIFRDQGSARTRRYHLKRPS
jgi:hypothetical protein